MSYEEEFDKIVRQKVSEADYPLDENDWSKASRILDARRAASHKTFLKKLLLPVGFVIGIGAAGIILFNAYATSGDKAERAENKASSAVSAPGKISSSKESVTEKTSDLNNKDLALKTDSSSEPATSNSEQSSQSVKPALRQEAVSAPKSVVLNNSATSKSSASVAQVNEAAGMDKEENLESAADVNTDNALAKGTVESPAEKAPVFGKAARLPEITEPVVEPSVSEKNAGEKNEEINVVMAKPEQQEEITEAVMSDYLSSIALQPEKMDNADISLPFVWLSRYDDYFSKKKLTHFLNAEIGGTYLFGWNTPKGNDGQGLNWFGGLNYGYYLCPKTSIGIGVQVYNITNITQPFYSSKKKNYGFGYTSAYSEITTDNLYYISVPVKLSYHINASNHVGIGFNTGYLLQGHSRVDSYETSSEQQIPGTPKGDGSNKIYDEATAIVNTMGSVFFSTKINPRFALNAEFIYGFKDLFKNAGNITTAEKPMGVRLSINYYLFNK